jgi:hypothetical protein
MCENNQKTTKRRRMAASPPSGRGRSFFKQRDVTRAVRSARAAGLAVDGVEVVTKDGTTIRILSKDTAEHAGGDNDLDAWIAKREKDARPA